MRRALSAGGRDVLGAAGPAVRRGRSGAMYRLLSPSLGGRLLRAAGRCCWVSSAPWIPGTQGSRASEVKAQPIRVPPPGRGLGLLPLLAGEERGLGWAGRSETGARAGPADLSAPCSARLVLETRGHWRGAAAGGGCGGRDGGSDHPAAEACQSEAVLLVARGPPGWAQGPAPGPACGRGLEPVRVAQARSRQAPCSLDCR